jgi:hypothetical protein
VRLRICSNLPASTARKVSEQPELVILLMKHLFSENLIKNFIGAIVHQQMMILKKLSILLLSKPMNVLAATSSIRIKIQHALRLLLQRQTVNKQTSLTLPLIIARNKRSGKLVLGVGKL